MEYRFKHDEAGKVKLEYFVTMKASIFAPAEEGSYTDVYFSVPEKLKELIETKQLNGFSFEDDPKQQIYVVDEVDMSQIPK